MLEHVVARPEHAVAVKEEGLGRWLGIRERHGLGEEGSGKRIYKVILYEDIGLLTSNLSRNSLIASGSPVRYFGRGVIFLSFVSVQIKK
jgi:hypothetical protein